MKRACIAIDDWKLAIFERHLSTSGYRFGRGPGLSPGTLFLIVETENLDALEIVVRSANTEAAARGKMQ